MHTCCSRELLRRWRRQIASRRRHVPSAPRDVGALGFLVDGGRRGDLIELNKLLLVVVYDEQRHEGSIAIRLCGYRASLVAEGVLWGGRENARVYRDLSLIPRRGARGLRVDLRRVELLQLALRLDHRISQAVRYQPSAYNRRFRLPRLWAGFRTQTAAGLCGQGPELETLCERFGVTPEAMFRKFERRHDGLTLYPLDWVSYQLDESLAVFAQMEGMPARQVFPLEDFPATLTGYEGAAAFDFYNSRFRPGVVHRPVLASAG